MTETIKVMLVDDEYLIRELLKRSVDWASFNMEIIAETGNALEVMAMVETLKPDVVFMDICMPHIDGVTLSEQLLKVYPRCRIMILTGHQNFEDAKRCVNLGVKGFLSKPINGSEISACLEKLQQEIRQSRLLAQNDLLQQQLTQGVQLATNAPATVTVVPESSPFLVAVTDYLQTHFSQPGLSLQEVADALFVHPNHLSRRFSQEAGVPFKDYLQKVRIEAALDLVKTTDLKSYEIARAIGMDDPNYFSVYFKKYMNMTIGEYRKQMKGKCR